MQTEQSHVKLVAIGVLQTRGACHLGADHGDTHGRGRRRGQQARLHPCKWCTARTVLPKTKRKKKTKRLPSVSPHRETCMPYVTHITRPDTRSRHYPRMSNDTPSLSSGRSNRLVLILKARRSAHSLSARPVPLKLFLCTNRFY